MTFTILARDPQTSDMGAAVASRWPGVGGVVPYHRAGVGIAASQSVANAAIGAAILDRMAAGDAPAQALNAAVAGGITPERRQVLALSADGETALWSGGECVPNVAEARGDNCVAAGNMLADPGVADAMIAAFAGAGALPFSERLLAALMAGEAAGGDRRGREAAGLMVWPADHPSPNRLPLDLRADHHDDPIAMLATLLARRREVDPGTY